MRFAHLAALTSFSLLATVFGCSDPIVATPKGAWAVVFTVPSDASACQIAPHNGAVGTLTSTSNAKVYADGESGAEIECTVSGSSEFSVDGIATQNGNALHIAIEKISTSATKDKPAKGVVTFSSSHTQGAYGSTNANPCDFWFEGKETVASGKVWVNFECPVVVLDMSTCVISNGVALFENCTDASSSSSGS